MHLCIICGLYNTGGQNTYLVVLYVQVNLDILFPHMRSVIAIYVNTFALTSWDSDINFECTKSSFLILNF